MPNNRSSSNPKKAEKSEGEKPQVQFLRFSHIFASIVREILEVKLLEEVAPHPLTLPQFHLLKAVAYGWRQLALADNAQEIRRLAEDLYGRLATFVTHMNKVGRQLASSVENYNRAVGSLERSVLPGARKFTELGVHAKKDIEKLESLEPVPRTMIEGNDT